jgi:MFS family permease
MNLLNYIDRWVPSAVKDLFKRDLDLTDAQTSLPLSAFIIVYMLASPIFGSLAERGNRRVLIAIGVAVWSLATAGAAFSQGFASLLLARSLVGVGEAAYATIAPTIIADYFHPDKRNKIFTIFYVATPVGSAIGFALGGLLGEHWGWRTAFLACGLPGLLVALFALIMNDPPRGQFDEHKEDPPPWSKALAILARNKQFVVTVAGYTAVTFATGGIADWFPTFLSRDRGVDMAAAGTFVGAATVVGGLGGTILGGVVADRVKQWTRQGYLCVSGLAMLPAIVLTVVAIYVVRAPTAIFACILVAQLFLWAYNAPVNAMLVNSVSGGMRARARVWPVDLVHSFVWRRREPTVDRGDQRRDPRSAAGARHGATRHHGRCHHLDRRLAHAAGRSFAGSERRASLTRPSATRASPTPLRFQATLLGEALDLCVVERITRDRQNASDVVEVFGRAAFPEELELANDDVLVESAFGHGRSYRGARHSGEAAGLVAGGRTRRMVRMRRGVDSRISRMVPSSATTRSPAAGMCPASAMQ